MRTSDITDVKRLTELIAQVKSRLQVSLSSSGHTVAAMRALSYQSRYAFYQDATLGIEYYQHITRLDEQIRTNPEAVVKKLQEMIDKVLVRLTLGGAAYLTFVCLVPEFLNLRFNVPFYFGGTSLLIVVVVTMDFMSQVQAYMMSHQYENLLKKTNFKGFGGGL